MSEIISNPVPSMRILKVASCPTSSGKATLTYHIGCTTDKDIQFRVVANTGGGLFSPEWVSLSAIQPAFEQAPFPLTSYPLIKLYQGKSTNTPAFLMAALKHEGLVRNLEGKIRGYEILDSKAFMDEVNMLIATGVNLKVAEIAANYKTSVAINKSAAPVKPALTTQTKKTKSSIEANSIR
ncbi:MAG: hypothetical protein WBC07_08285 [Methylotenera sp.]